MQLVNYYETVRKTISKEISMEIISNDHIIIRNGLELMLDSRGPAALYCAETFLMGLYHGYKFGIRYTNKILASHHS